VSSASVPVRLISFVTPSVSNFWKPREFISTRAPVRAVANRPPTTTSALMVPAVSLPDVQRGDVPVGDLHRGPGHLTRRGERFWLELSTATSFT
jgi:hypothetical protein